MADSIETFVQKLQQEGVQAGRDEANKLVAEAQAEAERIVAQATEQAESIVSDARGQAEQSLQQGREELQLAARDVQLRLREVVVQALVVVLGRSCTEALADQDFLFKLIRYVVVQYAQKDASGAADIEIQVSDEVLQSLTDWAAREMSPAGEAGKSQTSLEGGLKSAGFEYTAAGGTVEITPESISTVLGEMFSTRLRELLEKPAKSDQ